MSDDPKPDNVVPLHPGLTVVGEAPLSQPTAVTIDPINDGRYVINISFSDGTWVWAGNATDYRAVLDAARRRAAELGVRLVDCSLRNLLHPSAGDSGDAA